MPHALLDLGDGGQVEYYLSGPRGAKGLFVFHPGTPGAAAPFRALSTAAGRRGLRTLVYSRPGYAGSTRRPGRRVADEATTTARLADHLGADELVVAGWSGGGPAALACAALLGDRVRACLVLAGAAPSLEVGPAWADWGGPERVTEFETLRSERRESLVSEFEEAGKDLVQVTAADLAGRPGTPPADRRALRSSLGSVVAAAMRRGLAGGIWGWFDDAVAQANDWGFEVRAIRVPVTVRHGALDPRVDQRNGRWLAATIPGARGEFPADGGHASVMVPLAGLFDPLVN